MNGISTLGVRWLRLGLPVVVAGFQEPAPSTSAQICIIAPSDRIDHHNEFTW